MYAIVETGGLQFRLEKELKVKIPKLQAEVGSEVTFQRVLMVSDGKESLIGRPYVTEAQVRARLISHGRHDKIIVYKYKKRKNYRRKKGHRQDYTEVLVTEIVGPKLSAKKSAPEKKKAEPPESVKKRKVVKKKPTKAKIKEKKVAKPKAKPVKTKVAKKTTPKKQKATKPKAAPRGKKKPAGRVISRLRRKKTKE